MLVFSWLLLAPFLFDGCLGRSQAAVVGGQEGGPSQGPAGSLEMEVPQDAVKHETEHMDHMEGRLLNFFLESFSNDQKAVKKENNAMKIEEDSAEGQTDSAKEHMEVGEFLKQTEHLEVYKNLAAMATEAPAMEMEMTTVKTVKKSGSMLGQIVMRARKDQGRPRKVEQVKKTGMEYLEDRKDNVTRYDEGEENHKQLENMGDYNETIHIKNSANSEDGKHGNTSNEDVGIIVETMTLTGTSTTDMSQPSSDESSLSTDMSVFSTDMSAPYTDTSSSTDMSAPSTNMSASSTDMSAPSTDMSAPSTDMSAPSTDMSPPSTTSSPLLVDSLAQLFPVSPEAQTEDPDTLEVNMHQTLASVEVLPAQDRSDGDERRSSCRAGERGSCGGTQDGEDTGDNSIKKQPLIFPTGATKETSKNPNNIFEADEVTVEAEEVTVKENYSIFQRVINFFY